MPNLAERQVATNILGNYPVGTKLKRNGVILLPKPCETTDINGNNFVIIPTISLSLQTSFVVALSPSTLRRSIFAIDHYTNHKEYLMHKNYLSTFGHTLEATRVKFATNDQNELIIYKTSIFDAPPVLSSIAYDAGVSLVPALNHHTNLSNYTKNKKIEFMRYLGMSVQKYFSTTSLTSYELISILHQCFGDLHSFHTGKKTGKKTIHRDVKFDNFVVTSKHDIEKPLTVSLIDYDDAVVIGDEKEVLAYPVGTRGFLAPEIYDSSNGEFVTVTKNSSEFSEQAVSAYADSNELICSTVAVDIYALGESISRDILMSPQGSWRDALAKYRFLIESITLLMTDQSPKSRLGLWPVMKLLEYYFPALPKWEVNDTNTCLQDYVDWECISLQLPVKIDDDYFNSVNILNIAKIQSLRTLLDEKKLNAIFDKYHHAVLFILFRFNDPQQLLDDMLAIEGRLELSIVKSVFATNDVNKMQLFAFLINYAVSTKISAETVNERWQYLLNKEDNELLIKQLNTAFSQVELGFSPAQKQCHSFFCPEQNPNTFIRGFIQNSPEYQQDQELENNAMTKPLSSPKIRQFGLMANRRILPVECMSKERGNAKPMLV